jgi:hypothetical protein
MRPRIRAIIWITTVLAVGAIAALIVFRTTKPEGESKPAPVQETRGARVSNPDHSDMQAARQEDNATPAKPTEADSPEALADFIRQFAAMGANANDLYRKLAALGLKDRSWWRSSEEVSALLDLASDASLVEEYRIVAMTLFLGAAPSAQINENSAAIQQLALGAGDKMASAVLQGMADRSLRPAALIKAILISETRGAGAKCHAWYAARLTQKNDMDLAGIAISATQSGMTEASKVAFDYLAKGSFGPKYASDSNFQKKTDALLLTVQSLPTNADPIDLANGDAFIRATPYIIPTDAAVDSLLSLLHGAQNPEMKLSALEQLVSIHLSGAKNLTQELHELRNQTATLFPDPVKQNRAKNRLNRITSPQAK